MFNFYKIHLTVYSRQIGPNGRDGSGRSAECHRNGARRNRPLVVRAELATPGAVALVKVVLWGLAGA